MQITLISCFVYSLLFSSVNATEHDSPHALEALNQNQMANAKWDQFQDEMSWFLQYRNPKDSDADAFLKEKWLREYQALVQAISQSQKEFLKFRNKVASSLASNYGQCQYASSVYTYCELEVTEWYITYMKEKLFPLDWEERYKKYVSEREPDNNGKNTR